MTYLRYIYFCGLWFSSHESHSIQFIVRHCRRHHVHCFRPCQQNHQGLQQHQQTTASCCFFPNIWWNVEICDTVQLKVQLPGYLDTNIWKSTSTGPISIWPWLVIFNLWFLCCMVSISAFQKNERCKGWNWNYEFQVQPYAIFFGSWLSHVLSMCEVDWAMDQ